MKKEGNCYIEDILNLNKTEIIEQKTDYGNNNDDDDDKLKTEKNEREKKLGNNLIKLDEKNNFDLHAVSDKNPFLTALKGGAIATGAGIRVAYGSLVACITFDSVFLVSASGQILTAGITYLS